VIQYLVLKISALTIYYFFEDFSKVRFCSLGHVEPCLAGLNVTYDFDF
jgi:hypothetical protein